MPRRRLMAALVAAGVPLCALAQYPAGAPAQPAARGGVTASTAATTYVIGINGERIPDNGAVPQVAPPPSATPELDRAVARTLARTQAKLAHRQQLAYSITPRTLNDRSDQLPDDPLSPIFTR